jgi:hypothetical protein
VNAYVSGQNGQGPFVFLDPSRPNLLTPNQAGSGGFSNDASDFGVPIVLGLNNGLLDVTSLVLGRMGSSRSIVWNPSDSAGRYGDNSTLQLNGGYSNWLSGFGIPCIPGQTYTFSGLLNTDVFTFAVGANIQFTDFTGNVLATTSASTSISPTAGWLPFAVTATAPPNAVFLKLNFTAPAQPTNGGFATNVTGWSVSNGSPAIAWDGTGGFNGLGQLKMTPDGVTGTNIIQSSDFPALPGFTYNAQAAMYMAVTHTTGVGIDINFLNSGHSSISTVAQSDASPNVSPTFKQEINAGGVAPAGTAFIRVMIHINGTAPASHVLTLDDARVSVAGNHGVMISSLQLEYGSSAHDWAPGTGIRAVQPLALNEDETVDAWFRNTPSLVLQEVV